MTERLTTEEREVEPRHRHRFDAEIKDWWCDECNTVTDFCVQLNDFGQDTPYNPEGEE